MVIGGAGALRIEAEGQCVRGGDVDGADSDAPVPEEQVPEDAVRGGTASDDAPSEEVSPEEVPLEGRAPAAPAPADTSAEITPRTPPAPTPCTGWTPPTAGARVATRSTGVPSSACWRRPSSAGPRGGPRQ